ncbi:MAG: RHS repeat protein, partial [Actinomycetota bacterium]|nr:RHS repeat protein [Actinomycetota bacterium]
EIDLGEPKKIAGLRLLASQDPAGRTVHVISIDGLEVVTLDGETAGRDLLVVALASPVTGQVVRVTTTISPSWVAWYEIEIDLVP